MSTNAQFQMNVSSVVEILKNRYKNMLSAISFKHLDKQFCIRTFKAMAEKSDPKDNAYSKPGAGKQQVSPVVTSPEVIFEQVNMQNFPDTYNLQAFCVDAERRPIKINDDVLLIKSIEYSKVDQSAFILLSNDRNVGSTIMKGQSKYFGCELVRGAVILLPKHKMSMMVLCSRAQRQASYIECLKQLKQELETLLIDNIKEVVFFQDTPADCDPEQAEQFKFSFTIHDAYRKSDRKPSQKQAVVFIPKLNEDKIKHQIKRPDKPTNYTTGENETPDNCIAEEQEHLGFKGTLAEFKEFRTQADVKAYEYMKRVSYTYQNLERLYPEIYFTYYFEDFEITERAINQFYCASRINVLKQDPEMIAKLRALEKSPLSDKNETQIYLIDRGIYNINDGYVYLGTNSSQESNKNPLHIKYVENQQEYYEKVAVFEQEALKIIQDKIGEPPADLKQETPENLDEEKTLLLEEAKAFRRHYLNNKIEIYLRSDKSPLAEEAIPFILNIASFYKRVSPIEQLFDFSNCINGDVKIGNYRRKIITQPQTDLQKREYCDGMVQVYVEINTRDEGFPDVVRQLVQFLKKTPEIYCVANVLGIWGDHNIQSALDSLKKLIESKERTLIDLNIIENLRCSMIDYIIHGENRLNDQYNIPSVMKYIVCAEGNKHIIDNFKDLEKVCRSYLKKLERTKVESDEELEQDVKIDSDELAIDQGMLNFRGFRFKFLTKHDVKLGKKAVFVYIHKNSDLIAKISEILYKLQDCGIQPFICIYGINNINQFAHSDIAGAQILSTQYYLPKINVVEYRHGFNHFIARCPDRVFFYKEVNDISSKGSPGQRCSLQYDTYGMSQLIINSRSVVNLTCDDLIPEGINQPYVDKENIQHILTVKDYLNNILTQFGTNTLDTYQSTFVVKKPLPDQVVFNGSVLNPINKSVAPYVKQKYYCILFLRAMTIKDEMRNNWEQSLKQVKEYLQDNQDTFLAVVAQGCTETLKDAKSNVMGFCSALSSYYILDDINQSTKMAYNMYGDKYSKAPFLLLRFDVTKDEQLEFTSFEEFVEKTKIVEEQLNAVVDYMFEKTKIVVDRVSLPVIQNLEADEPSYTLFIQLPTENLSTNLLKLYQMKREFITVRFIIQIQGITQITPQMMIDNYYLDQFTIVGIPENFTVETNVVHFDNSENRKLASSRGNIRDADGRDVFDPIAAALKMLQDEDPSIKLQLQLKKQLIFGDKTIILDGKQHRILHATQELVNKARICCVVGSTTLISKSVDDMTKLKQQFPDVIFLFAMEKQEYEQYMFLQHNVANNQWQDMSKDLYDKQAEKPTPYVQPPANVCLQKLPLHQLNIIQSNQIINKCEFFIEELMESVLDSYASCEDIKQFLKTVNQKIPQKLMAPLRYVEKIQPIPDEFNFSAGDITLTLKQVQQVSDRQLGQPMIIQAITSQDVSNNILFDLYHDMLMFPQLYFCVCLIDPNLKDYCLGQFVDRSPMLANLNVYLPTNMRTAAATLLLQGTRAQQFTVIGDKGVAGANLSNYVTDKLIPRYRLQLPEFQIVKHPVLNTFTILFKNTYLNVLHDLAEQSSDMSQYGVKDCQKFVVFSLGKDGDVSTIIRLMKLYEDTVFFVSFADIITQQQFEDKFKNQQLQAAENPLPPQAMNQTTDRKKTHPDVLRLRDFKESCVPVEKCVNLVNVIPPLDGVPESQILFVYGENHVVIDNIDQLRYQMHQTTFDSGCELNFVSKQDGLFEISSNIIRIAGYRLGYEQKQTPYVPGQSICLATLDEFQVTFQEDVWRLLQDSQCHKQTFYVVAFRRQSTFEELFKKFPYLQYMNFVHYLGGMERLARFTYWDSQFRRQANISSTVKPEAPLTFKATKDGLEEFINLKGMVIHKINSPVSEENNADGKIKKATYFNSLPPNPFKQTLVLFIEKVLPDNKDLLQFMEILQIFGDVNVFCLTTSTAEELIEVKKSTIFTSIVFFADCYNLCSYYQQMSPIPGKFTYLLSEGEEMFAFCDDDLRCLNVISRKQFDENAVQAEFEKQQKDQETKKAIATEPPKAK